MPRDISDTKLQKAIGFEPHPIQKEIIDSNQRDIVICAGRRWGKSMICAYLALKVLLQDNKKIWIVAPTYDLAGKVFNYIVQWFLRVAPSQANGVSTRIPQKIQTAGNSVLECKSADSPEALLGEEVDLLIIDEAAQIPRKIWEMYLFPVTSSRKAKVVKISTPYGKNWFYEEFIRAKENNGAFHLPSNNNPYFSPEEWERARNLLPEVAFKQNYLAVFTEGAGQVFRNIRECVGQNIYEDAKVSGRYVMGVDLAKYKDFSVIFVVDIYSHKVVYFDRFKEVSWPLQKGRIIAVHRRYNNARVYIDSTGLGDPIADDLAREGVLTEDFKLSNKSKQQVVEKLAIFFEQKGIIIPNESVIIDELESYQYDFTESGKLQYSAPAGLHDDCVIALALAVWGLDSPKANNPAYAPQSKKKLTAYPYL